MIIPSTTRPLLPPTVAAFVWDTKKLISEPSLLHKRSASKKFTTISGCQFYGLRSRILRSRDSCAGTAREPVRPKSVTYVNLTSKYVLPVEPLHSRHHIEVSIPAQQRKTVLAAQCGNPKVIRWDRFSGLSQFDADSCIMMRSLFVNVEHSAVSHETIQPPPIPSPIARLCDPEAIFPNYHDWKR